MPTGCLWGPKTYLPMGQMQPGTEAVWEMPGANPEQGSPAPGPPPREGSSARPFLPREPGYRVTVVLPAVNTGVSIMVEH